MRQNVGEAAGEERPLIRTIGEQLFEKREPAEQRRKQQDAAVAILNVGAVNGGAHQQALRIDENVALLALDLLARVIAVRIDARPPFSALFTL